MTAKDDFEKIRSKMEIEPSSNLLESRAGKVTLYMQWKQ